MPDPNLVKIIEEQIEILRPNESTENVSELSEKVIAIFEKIDGSAMKLADATESIIKTCLELIKQNKEIIDDIEKSISTTFDSIVKSMDKVAEKISTLDRTKVGSEGNINRVITEKNLTMSMPSKIYTNISASFMKLIDGIKSNIKGGFTGFFKFISDGFKHIIVNPFKAIGSFFTNLLASNPIKALSQFKDNLQNKWKSMRDTLSGNLVAGPAKRSIEQDYSTAGVSSRPLSWDVVGNKTAVGVAVNWLYRQLSKKPGEKTKESEGGGFIQDTLETVLGTSIGRSLPGMMKMIGPMILPYILPFIATLGLTALGTIAVRGIFNYFKNPNAHASTGVLGGSSERGFMGDVNSVKPKTPVIEKPATPVTKSNNISDTINALKAPLLASTAEAGEKDKKVNELELMMRKDYNIYSKSRYAIARLDKEQIKLNEEKMNKQRENITLLDKFSTAFNTFLSTLLSFPGKVWEFFTKPPKPKPEEDITDKIPNRGNYRPGDREAYYGNKRETDRLTKTGVLTKDKYSLKDNVYDSLIAAGFTPFQAKALFAEIGRENDFNRKYIFGEHTDDSNKQRNLGLISWQKGRRDNLIKELEAAGLYKDGKIVESRQSIDVMTNFMKKEMESKSYKGRLSEFLSGKITDSDEASKVLREKYIINKYIEEHDKKRAKIEEHDKKRAKYYKEAYDRYGNLKSGETANQKYGMPNISKEHLAEITTSKGLKAFVHKMYQAQAQGFIDELERSGYDIKSLAGFSKRFIAGTSTPSKHAYGAAFDINAIKNPVTTNGQLITDMPKNIQEIAKKWGLGWGGAWSGNKKDPMHFSFDKYEGGKYSVFNDIKEYLAAMAKNTEKAVDQAEVKVAGNTTPETQTYTTSSEISINPDIPAYILDYVFGLNLVSGSTGRFGIV